MNASDTQTSTEHTLYSVPETCQILRISRWMFYRLVQNRELRTITIGRRRLVSAADLTRYITERQEDAS